ncbi:pyridoxamine 5'-phosphate oxidase [Nibribacter koreensis]|uniref:Pyridoxine/pyridoxamine 5'-phosphate oxidase n=1 Tax=Nibribacter koreensis TaxID=1084519 RepID=A0ABP8F9I0_9BACT
MEKPLSLADIRSNYAKQILNVEAVDANPLRQFDAWMQEALQAKVEEPTAMTLSTASLQGRPSARIVLLKAIEDGGFVFYTNYESRKGQQLAENPFASLTFFWPALERQVRVEGKVVKVEPTTSDAYFNSRPRGSQLGAWSSPQSQTIESRKVLEDLELKYSQEFSQQETIPRPAHWGGYKLVPDRIEFWQGRPNRLHDRLLYHADAAGQWTIERLAP